MCFISPHIIAIRNDLPNTALHLEEPKNQMENLKCWKHLLSSKLNWNLHLLCISYTTYFDTLPYLLNNLSSLLPGLWKTVFSFFLKPAVTHSFHLPEFQIFCYHDFEAWNYVSFLFLKINEKKEVSKTWMNASTFWQNTFSYLFSERR